MLAPVRLRQDNLIGSVRSQQRQRLALSRHRLRFCARNFVARNEPRHRRPLKHAVARGTRGFGETVRPPQLRRLRQGDQQRGLGQRQFAGLLAEIGQRGRANAFEVPAIGGKGQVEMKYLSLVERALELECAHHLPQLGAQTASLAWLKKARNLHGDRRSTGHDMASGCELDRRTSQCERIDARMLAETLVFVCKEQLQETRIDVLLGNRQPPTAFVGRIGTQKSPLSIEDNVRIFETPAERDRPEGIDPPRTGQPGRDGGTGSCRKNLRPASHFGEISIALVAVRPNLSGWYMSSTFACGRTYRPGETARTTYATLNTGFESCLRSNAAAKRSSRNSVLIGSTASAIHVNVPVSPDDTSRGLSISKPAGRSSATMTRPNCGCGSVTFNTTTKRWFCMALLGSAFSPSSV